MVPPLQTYIAEANGAWNGCWWQGYPCCRRRRVKCYEAHLFVILA